MSNRPKLSGNKKNSIKTVTSIVDNVEVSPLLYIAKSQSIFQPENLPSFFKKIRSFKPNKISIKNKKVTLPK